MGAITKLSADLELNNARFNKDLKRSTAQTKKFRVEASKTNDNVIWLNRSFRGAAQGVAAIDGPLGGISSRISSVNSLVSSGTLKWTALGAGIAAATFAMWKSVQAGEATERQLLKQEALLRATGAASGKTVEMLDDQARSVARATLASTNGIREAQGVLLTFRSISGDVFNDAVKLSQDLSAVMGGDAKSAALQLAKALEDPKNGLTALRRAGVSFTETEKDVIKKLHETGEAAQAQRLILAKLASQVGGAGEAEAKGLSGAFDTLGQSVTEFLEKTDKKLGSSTALTDFVNSLSGAVDNLSSKIEAPVSDDKEFVELTNRRLDLEKELAELQSNRGSFAGFLLGYDQQILNKKAEQEAVERRLNELRDARLAKNRAEVAAESEQLRIKQEALQQQFEKEQELLAKQELKRQERIAKEAEEITLRYESQLEQLDLQLASEEERLAMSYERRNETIRNALANRLIEEVRYQELLAKNTAKFQSDRARLDQKNKKKGEKLDKNHWVTGLKGTAKYFGNIASLSMSGSKTLFKIQKAAAIGQALVSLPASVVEAVRNAGGLPFGAFAGAATLAHGLSQIAAIRSQDIDAGSSSSASAPSGGDYSAPSIAPEAITPEADEEALERRVVVQYEMDEGDLVPVRTLRRLNESFAEQVGLNVEVAA